MSRDRDRHPDCVFFQRAMRRANAFLGWPEAVLVLLGFPMNATDFTTTDAGIGRFCVTRYQSFLDLDIAAAQNCTHGI